MLAVEVREQRSYGQRGAVCQWGVEVVRASGWAGSGAGSGTGRPGRGERDAPEQEVKTRPPTMKYEGLLSRRCGGTRYAYCVSLTCGREGRAAQAAGCRRPSHRTHSRQSGVEARPGPSRGRRARRRAQPPGARPRGRCPPPHAPATARTSSDWCSPLRRMSSWMVSPTCLLVTTYLRPGTWPPGTQP